MPRRANTVGQCATAAPESRRRSKSLAVRMVDLRMVVEEDAVADHQVGPEHADISSHSIGVFPCRRTIS